MIDNLLQSDKSYINLPEYIMQYTIDTTTYQMDFSNNVFQWGVVKSQPWSSSSLSPSGHIVWNEANKLFLTAQGNKTGIWWSNDAINWIQSNITTGLGSLNSWITWSSDLSKFCAVNGQYSYTSTDGKSWTQSSALTPTALKKVVWFASANVFVAVNQHYGNPIWYSSDGLTWTQASSTFDYAEWINDIVVTPTGLVGLGGKSFAGYWRNRKYTSTDGSTWSGLFSNIGDDPVGIPNATYYNDMTYVSSLGLIVGIKSGTYGGIFSLSGDTLTVRAPSSYSLVYSDKVTAFLAGHSTGYRYSYDGINWTTKTKTGDNFIALFGKR